MVLPPLMYASITRLYVLLVMGINDLWEVLEPAATMVPLISLAIQDRYEGPTPHSPYIVGVDASAWFEQCQQGRWHHAHAQTGQNPALQTFLFRLARLARLPVQLIFVFDGNQRSEIKWGHRVSTNDHWMVKPTQRLLNAFNIQWIMAAGEAEAQLALMNGACDAFVFSAQTVLRNSTFSIDSTVKMYTTSAIQEHVDPHLTNDGFLTLAICCLPGCGRETALGLARCMDAGVLRAAICGNSLDGPLQQWRDTTRYHLVDDPTGKMGRSHPALARLLPDSFPDPRIINLYAQPAVTPITKLPILQSPALPDIAPLASLVQQLLGWESKKVVSTFCSTIWPVVVLHEVLEDLANNSPASDEIALAPACTRAVFQSHAVRPKKALAGVPGHNNDVPTHDLEQSTLQLLEDLPGCSHCEDHAPRSHKFV
ncbi:PIN domain-like protein [Suillus subalutaceus]|uniref:PIN domain-like protein n=1 Tax=Suillus subalutaceus TaxID=48586 RepID=UPI001B867D74|nr:PIN domain-like protein [Suillus subalutaceus]KAG1841547.1 PIN domain-like protein [Suillus subalutaceus]